MAFITLDELSTKEPIPGCFAKFVHSEQMTLASWEIGANTLFPEHSHPHEQIMLVVEGEFELTVGAESKVVRPGVVAVIPSGVSHSGRALTDCRVIDAFHPVREDYR
jgi:quercetin dioxygenase-like cupin family protein